ncbi:MAG: winged helix-turn-helix domain-containing protein [Bryobacteraceae bacterium]
MPEHGVLYRFGSFEMDGASRELRKHGVRLKFEEQPFRLLAGLVERQGDVVTREELKKSLWPDETYGDFDRGLNRVVNKIRIALGDSAVNPRFIETLPRRGYRFLAPVSIVERPGSQPESVPPDIAPLDSQPIQTPRNVAKWYSVRPKSVRWQAALAVLVGAAAVASLTWFGISRVRAPRFTALAVLPLEGVAREGDEGDFAYGMTDQLIASLSRISSLRVVSLKSMMHYKGTRTKLADVAKELKVDGLVEGSLFVSNGNMRMNIRLVRFPGEQTVWTKSYERSAAEAISLQREIAQNVAQEIGAAITPDDRKRLAHHARSIDPALQELYSKGRFLATEQSRDSIERGLKILEKVIEKEPDYAPAYAAVAEGWFGLASVYLPPLETMPKARAAAHKAIELDPELDDARAVLGRVHVFYDWDWSAAEEQFRKALDSNPNSENAYKGLACLRMVQGRGADALTNIDLALRIDPRSLWLHFMAVLFRTNERRYPDAIRQADQSLDWEPGFGMLRSFTGVIHALQGESAVAIREAEMGVKQQPVPTTMGFLALGYALAGKKAEAERVLADLIARADHQYVCPFEVASVYACLGRMDETFDWLAKSVAERADCTIWLRSEPWLDPIRDDPRYTALVRKLWLP